MAKGELTTRTRRRLALACAGALACALGLAGAVGACSDRSDAEEQARRVWGAYCDQAQNCSFSGFQRVFGGSYEACVRRGLDGLPPGQEAAFCSGGEVDSCVAAIQSQGCPPFDDWTRDPLDSRSLPEPCPRCSPVGPALVSDGGAGAP